MSAIPRPMKSSIKCVHSKIQKKLKVTNVLLLTFAVFTLIYCLPLISFFSTSMFLKERNNILVNGSFRATRFNSGEVLGWEKSKSRNANDYVFPDKLTTMTVVNHTCQSEKSFLLVVVCTEIDHFEHRRAIRETWAMNARRNHINVLFLMGIDARRELEPEVIEENSKYGDIIVENFIDSYNNLTIKSIMMLKWIDQNCRNAKFVMKVDDDVYVNVNNLRKLIEPMKDTDVRGFLLGKLYSKERPDRKPSSKWFMPKYIFPDDTYPQYLCGVGYVMSSDVAQILYRESLKNELVYLEDLFITGICAKSAKLNLIDNLGFRFFEHPVHVECNSIHPHLILLSHHLSASKMRNQHEQVLECWREMVVPPWFRDD